MKTIKAYDAVLGASRMILKADGLRHSAADRKPPTVGDVVGVVRKVADLVSFEVESAEWDCVDAVCDILVAEFATERTEVRNGTWKYE